VDASAFPRAQMVALFTPQRLTEMSWSKKVDFEELLRQFLDLKRSHEELTQRVYRLEDEVVLLGDDAGVL
jgi:hypothetical protein